MAKYQRSNWFQGLLDAEACSCVEPSDWDWPGFSDYCAGISDYRRHWEETLMPVVVDNQSRSIRNTIGRMGRMMIGDGLDG